MLNKIKAAFAAFFIALMCIAWPLFLTVSFAFAIGFIVYKAIRYDQEEEKNNHE